MKTFSAFVLIGFLAGPLCCFAQEEEAVTLYSKKVSPEEAPQAIKDALKKDFPDAVNDIEQYYKVPENMLDTEWGVALSESLQKGETEHYTVKMKGKGGGYVYGLYNKDGELEVLKMEAYEFDLPDAIKKAATTGNYQGYEIKSQKYKSYKVIDKRTNEEFIQVDVEKGDDRKTLFFNTQGELVKEKG